MEIGLRWTARNRAAFWVGTRQIVAAERFILTLAQAALTFFTWMREAVGTVGDRDYEAIQALVERLESRVAFVEGKVPFRPLTSDEARLVRHM